jgi:hypothetical protein
MGLAFHRIKSFTGRVSGTVLRLMAVAGLGLALGACSKCDVWKWVPNQQAQPHSCHDEAPPQ